MAQEFLLGNLLEGLDYEDSVMVLKIGLVANMLQAQEMRIITNINTNILIKYWFDISKSVSNTLNVHQCL